MRTAPVMNSEVLQDRPVHLFSDLLVAIIAHSSPPSHNFPASEANAVVLNFQRLPVADKQAILDFLRSL